LHKSKAVRRIPLGGGMPLFQLTDLKYHTIIKSNLSLLCKAAFLEPAISFLPPAERGSTVLRRLAGSEYPFKAAASFRSEGGWKGVGLFYFLKAMAAEASRFLALSKIGIKSI
jgi:hypothetical protein